jgi:hypothetical protein
MFRFTIRDVLWLTVVVGVAAAWWTDQRWLRANIRATTYEYRELQSEYVKVKQTRDETLDVLREAHRAIQSGKAHAGLKPAY